ncbi:MAG: sulfite exporter TauE/SafE family protein [Butyricicoccaceae bacterium]
MTIQLAIYVFIVQFLAFILKGMVGFGNPLISSPLMAMKLNNSVITPGNLLLDIPVNISIVYQNRKSFLPKIALPIAAFVMIGVVPGSLFLKVGNANVIKALLGILIIFIGIEMATRKPAKPGMQPNYLIMGAVSLFSGFMSGIFGINMLFLAYIDRYCSDTKAFKSNVCFVFVLENIFRAIVYLVTGIFTINSLLVTLVSAPAAVLGLAVGRKLDHAIEERMMKKITYFVFILGGCSILIKAILAML